MSHSVTELYEARIVGFGCLFVCLFFLLLAIAGINASLHFISGANLMLKPTMLSSMRMVELVSGVGPQI